MAKLDYPLYGDTATGTLGRALAYRRTQTFNTVAKIPIVSCPPSPEQTAHRAQYQAASIAWNGLTTEEKAQWNINKPTRLTGYNFFIKLHLSPDYAYFGYCIFGTAWFQVVPGPDQPAENDFDISFPAGLDEFVTMQDGKHNPQAWIFNRLYDTIQNIETYLLTHDAQIKT